ncbi:MAG: hypothetical protein KDA49_16930 [Rhodospirillaceae bacterium]|nr:hypothetical protein [Rhodospirillaceae bacterium]MCA8934164.1 hypothetical protein [Rhodospirillaceae bacterium]MCB9957899.1 hypothetical protein [Rhodospirillaceae bacterium]
MSYVNPKEALAATTQIDLSDVSSALCAKGFSRLDAEFSVIQYQQLLALHALYPTLMLVPPKAADEALHIHLENGRFEQDCLKLFGSVPQHTTEWWAEQMLPESWELTRDLYRQHFGVELSKASAAGCGIAPADMNGPAGCGIAPADMTGPPNGVTTH